MCGIAGALDLRPGLPSAEGLVAEMTDALLHRGPDDAGLLVDPPVVLGHRRRAIFDLSSRGRQPMASRDRRLWVVYNGDVYNHIELADDLRERGYQFHTTCDTEVLLAAFEEWGTAALERMNGDFALAIWDRERRELLCVRDRFGAKPFYHTIVDGRFRFASEIKALLVDPEVPRVPNDTRVAEFLAYGLIDYSDETLFEGIRQLPAGSLMTVTPAGGPGEPVVYYRPRPAELDGRSPVEEVRERLTEAVRLRLRSDVPIGVALSGGLDSASVMSVASRLLSEEAVPPPISFSARCLDQEIDEGKWAQHVIRATGARNVDVTPNDRDLLSELDTLLWNMDEPFHSPTVYGHWKVFQLARQSDVVVVLEGQAGDDVFCGYTEFYSPALLTMVRRGRIGRAVSEVRWRKRRVGVPVRRSLVHLAKFLVPRRLRQRYRPAWLSRDLHVPRPSIPGRSVRDKQLHCLGVMPMPGFVHHDDRNAMSLGLAGRSPFLDYNVVECGLALEPDDLIRDGFSKWALREAMRGIVPGEILERAEKQGFSVDQSDWFSQGELGDLVEEVFRSERMASRLYFDRAKLVETLEEHRSGRRDRSHELWRAFVVERWLRLFVDPPVLEAPERHPSAPTSPVRAFDNVVRLSEAHGAAA